MPGNALDANKISVNMYFFLFNIIMDYLMGISVEALPRLFISY